MSTSSNAPAHLVVFYVRSTAQSVDFYTRLLGQPPVEQSPGFAMFALGPGLMLGLWAIPGVLPPATPAGGAELVFALPSAAEVKARHAAWNALSVPMAQMPAALDFGYTFTALDPDGHRLRVFAAAEA